MVLRSRGAVIMTFCYLHHHQIIITELLQIDGLPTMVAALTLHDPEVTAALTNNRIEVTWIYHAGV